MCGVIVTEAVWGLSTSIMYRDGCSRRSWGCLTYSCGESEEAEEAKGTQDALGSSVPHLRAGTGRAHILTRACQGAKIVPRQAQAGEDGCVALLDPGGVGVEVLDGVQRGAEEGAGAGVGFLDEDGGEDLREAFR